VVDDTESFRRFIVSTLQARPELQVIGEVSDGLEAVRKAQELHPDLILLDIGLPGLNGVEAARRIRRFSPKSKILFVSQESSPDIVQEAFSLGACGYVVKMDAGGELLAAVDAALRDEQFVGSRFAGHDFTGVSNAQVSEGVHSNSVFAPLKRQNLQLTRHEAHTVAAAANLQFAMQDVADRFQKETGKNVKVIYGSSGNFFQQLQNGTPFDTFFSANLDYPKKLEAAGLSEPGSYYQYAKGRIVIWVPKDSKLDLSAGLQVLLNPSIKKIAVANPQHAPYGQAAVAAMQKAGIYESERQVRAWRKYLPDCFLRRVGVG
jgi:DNA-binding NarL/FixJ family response regulator